MAGVEERKGVPDFDRTQDGGAGTGAELKAEGTEDKPFDPGLFAKLVDVNWGKKSVVTGQFICVGYSFGGGNRLLATVDTNADDPAANTQALKRGWITTFNKQIFIYQFGAQEIVSFDVAMRVPMFGHAHVLIVGGSTRQLVGHTHNLCLVVCSLDNGKTWTDLRFPDFDSTKGYFVAFLAWDPAARVMYAGTFPNLFGLGTDGVRLYKFIPGADPTVAGTWTLVDHSLYGPNVPPTFGSPPIPHALPVGSWIINDTTYYDDGLGGYNYWGLNNGQGWYGGKVVFTGSDGKEHTLEQKANDVVRVDGVILNVVDSRFAGFNEPSAGNGLVVAGTPRLFDPPDFTGPIDGGQHVLIGTADIAALVDPLADGSAAHPFAKWEQISPTDITPDFFYIQCAFGRNKL